ncbi:hypothetical protein RHSP_33009 [Rhizobium freirei PRF 81]|uniref:Uncharacterized protein n=1 Tax=Rhizobium freirei PRF 81 TaxID=363754 RepID=N6UWV0_9HYPH|nr:hypothetical protein RHSP_33009 [Rhizobium freirei PRF 81]
MALGFEHFERRRLEGGLLLLRPGLAGAGQRLAAHRGEHARCLLPAHDRDAAVGPGPEEARRIGAAGHAVIAGTEGATDQHGDLRNLGRRNGRHQLRTVLGYTLSLVFPANHETGDVLQEDERNFALRAKFDEMRAFQRRLREEHAVIGDDANGNAVDMGEAADQRRAVARLEFIEAGAVHHAGYDFAHIIGRAQVGRNDAEDFFGIVERRLRRAKLDAVRLAAIEIGDHLPGERKRMGIVARQMIGDAGKARMDIAAAEILGRDHLPRRRLDERRTGEKDRPLLLDDDGFVGHSRHIGAACRAGAHDDGNLRNAGGRHIGLIVEDAAEMIAIRKDFVLVRQVGATGIDEIDAREIVLRGDLLRAKMLLHRDRIVGAAFDRGIVADDHAVTARNAADAGDQAGARGLIAMHSMGGRRADLQKRRGGIDQAGDAIARQHLAAAHMPLARLRSAAFRRLRRRSLGDPDRLQQRRTIVAEAIGMRRYL